MNAPVGSSRSRAARSAGTVSRASSSRRRASGAVARISWSALAIRSRAWRSRATLGLGWAAPPRAGRGRGGVRREVDRGLREPWAVLEQDGAALFVRRLVADLDEEQGGADRDPVAVLQEALADGHAVDERAVAALEVAQEKPAVPRLDHAVVPGDREIPEVDVVRLVTAEGQPVGRQRERLARQGSGDGDQGRNLQRFSLHLDRDYLNRYGATEVVETVELNS